MRYSIIDGFRGFFLFTMMTAHLNYVLGGVLPTLNHHRLGWVEDAQGFVFVSGLVIGIVYGKMLLHGTSDKMISAIWRRMISIFRHHAFLAVAITMLAIFFADRAPEIYHRFGDMPVLYGALTLVLLAGPEYVDILPMYLVFIAFTPVALIACARGYYLGVIAVSVATWALAQTGLVGPTLNMLCRAVGLADHGIWLGLFFNRFAWQILYFGGLVAGMAFIQGKLKVESFAAPAWRPVFLTALAVTFVFLLLALVRQVAPEMLPQAFNVAASRPNLAVLRLANFASDLIVVVWLLTVGVVSASPLWRGCGRALRVAFTWRPLVFLGQHSLPVYTYHVIAVYLFLTFVDFRSMPPIWNEIVPFLGALSLFLPAWLHARYLRGQNARKTDPTDTERRVPTPAREHT
jgi:hypothetical protein